MTALWVWEFWPRTFDVEDFLLGRRN